MAFNLSYSDKGADLSDAGSNFKTYAKAAKSKDATKETPKEDPKKPKATSDTTKPATTESPATKLMGIINKNGGSPTQSTSNQNPATKQPTLGEVAPANPLTSTDSLNVNIGLVHNYQQSLGKQLLTRGMEEGMADMDKEAEDPNYLSLDRKNAAAMELRNALLDAKKRGVGMDGLKLSPMASALHSGFINQAANKLISENKYQPYLTTGAGLSIK